MTQYLWIGAGGFLGAVARFGVYRATVSFYSGAFPIATMLINISGCFLIGFAAAVAPKLVGFDSFYSFFAIGVLGAYTTFSTFGLENLKLIESGNLLFAVLNSCLQVIAGTIAVYAGRSMF